MSKPKNLGTEVKAFLRDRIPYNEIAARLGVSKGTIAYHAKIIGPPNRRRLPKYNWPEIVAYYVEGHTYKECGEKFGVTLGSMWKAAKRGLFVPRSCGNPVPVMAYMKRWHGRKASSGRQGIRKKILAAGLIPYRCFQCGLSEWRGEPLTLNLDHKSGDSRDSRLSNLRFVCPNCDSQQATFGAKNRGKYDHASVVEFTVDTPVSETGVQKDI